MRPGRRGIELGAVSGDPRRRWFVRIRRAGRDGAALGATRDGRGAEVNEACEVGGRCAHVLRVGVRLQRRRRALIDAHRAYLEHCDYTRAVPLRERDLHADRALAERLEAGIRRAQQEAPWPVSIGAVEVARRQHRAEYGPAPTPAPTHAPVGEPARDRAWCYTDPTPAPAALPWRADRSPEASTPGDYGVPEGHLVAAREMRQTEASAALRAGFVVRAMALEHAVRDIDSVRLLLHTLEMRGLRGLLPGEPGGRGGVEDAMGDGLSDGGGGASECGDDQ